MSHIMTGRAVTKKKIATRSVMGRPDLIDPERTQTLINAIRLGSPLKTCCAFAGISTESFRKWRRRGEASLLIDEKKRTPTQKRYADFVVEIDKALAESNIRAQSAVHALMTKPVENSTPEQQRVILSAATFHLTHRDGENYTTRSRTELTGADGGPIDVELSADMAWERLRAILSRGSDDD